MSESGKSDGGLIAIAIFKLVKATLLVALGVGLFKLGKDGDVLSTVGRFIHELRLDPGNRLVHKALEKATGADPKKLKELGVGTFVYAAIFTVEGIGLLLKKKWAEWLTVVVTTSFIPFEIYEVTREASPARIGGLVVNVAVVVYLVAKLVRDAKQGKKPETRTGVARRRPPIGVQRSASLG